MSYILFKRFFISLIIATLIGAGALTPVAQAQTTQSSQDTSIWSGLWAGVNLEFDKVFNSSKTTSSTTTSAPATRSTPTAKPASTAGTYAALGDSVAAGVGLPTVSQVPSNYARCGRTAQAYPHEVARAMNLQLNHVACSGATAGDLFTKQRSGSPNLPAQLDVAFASGKPQLITITAGANDAHWVELLYSCYNYNCATATTTAIANAYLTALQVKLFALFSDIKVRSGNAPPTVVITGYYNPISPACTKLVTNFTAQEVAWMTAEVNALNQTIRQVAAYYPFVKYAPVNFTGHDVCSTQPWIQGRSDKRPFHPTAEGQRVIARSVISAAGR